MTSFLFAVEEADKSPVVPLIGQDTVVAVSVSVTGLDLAPVERWMLLMSEFTD